MGSVILQPGLPLTKLCICHSVEVVVYSLNILYDVLNDTGAVGKNDFCMSLTVVGAT